MPSKGRDRARGVMALMRSQGLGVACGQVSVLLLAVGSVILAARHDLYADLALDDLRFFFEHPSPWHLWFYLLVLDLAVFALNTLLCTWSSVMTKIRARVRAPAAYAPAVLHLSFLVALLAHLAGGVWGRVLPPILLGPTWRPLPWGASARATSLEVVPHPDGSLAKVRIGVEVRDAAGAVDAQTLGFNAPVVLGHGQRLLLLGRFQEVPAVARLRTPSGACVLERGASCQAGGWSLRLLDLGDARGVGQSAFFEATARDGRRERFGAWPGLTHVLSDGTTLRLQSIEARPVVQVTPREMPGNLLALGAALLLGVGVLLFGRRWL